MNPNVVRINSKAGFSFEMVPTEAMLDAGLGKDHVWVYTRLRLESARGKTAVAWKDGAPVGLPKYHTHLSIERDAAIFELTPSTLRRVIWELQEKQFIKIRTLARRGTIIQFNDFRQIPSCVALAPKVKDTGGELSEGNSYGLSVYDTAYWRILKDTLEDIKREKPSLFKRIFSILQESFGGYFGGTYIPSSDIKTNTEISTNCVKGPPIGDLALGSDVETSSRSGSGDERRIKGGLTASDLPEVENAPKGDSGGNRVLRTGEAGKDVASEFYDANAKDWFAFLKQVSKGEKNAHQADL